MAELVHTSPESYQLKIDLPLYDTVAWSQDKSTRKSAPERDELSQKSVVAPLNSHARDQALGRVYCERGFLGLISWV
eukprot:1661560-Rhodomonas_salina.1